MRFLANIALTSYAVIHLASASEDNTQTGESLFALKVFPMLSSKCLACHGDEPSKVKGDLVLTSRKALLKGGDSGTPALTPGKPMQSPLFLAATREHEPDWSAMPPKENDRLNHRQIEALKEWITLGAPWPDEKTRAKYTTLERKKIRTAEGLLVNTSGGLSEEWTYRRYLPADIWAFQPIQKTIKPQHSKNPVDAFVLQKLKSTNINPAPQAHFRTLVRRAYYDLTGLPPTPFEIYQFRLQWDKDPTAAWNKLIDMLLASPHYGERWGQHWLDIVRYSDTGGYSNDYERSNAWRYRDYVIRSFNNDKPYSDFVVEQIAGDEIWEMQPVKKRNPELLIASSFLRMGPWDPAMVKIPEARQIYLDDVVNAVGQTFLSTTMRCFKCHDHKFDPLPTRDYYRMYAVFAGTQLAERPAPFLQNENLSGFKEGRSMTQKLLNFATAEHESLYDKQESAAREWFKANGKDYIDEKARRKLPDEEKPPRHVGLSPEETGRKKVREQDQWIWNRRMERYQPMVQGVYNGPDPKSLNARSMRMPKSAPKAPIPQIHILMGGSLEAPSEKVTPGVLSGIGIPSSSDSQDPYQITQSPHGRRLALAKWIVDPRNTITARSIVNRVWQHHFGKPLAGNPNNFGTKGGKPTHPQLLDWLAADFMENGWRIKRLHRMIMTSDTYRQSGNHPNMSMLRNTDPDNKLIAYRKPRRLTAEELRDSMLKTTGELNTAIGGLPVYPEINMEVALQPRMIQFSIAPAYQPSRLPLERNRRTIYAYRTRGQPDPFLELFNQPNPNDSCEERDSTSVSPQALTLLNSQVMTDRSIALAIRIEREFDTLHLQVKRAVQLAFGRVPSKPEWERLKNYTVKMQGYHAKHHPLKITYPKSIVRSLVEEFTGQPFQYKEILPVFENYVPDKRPFDVPPKTRALADLCLLLFNSNEFIYVY